MSRNISTNLVNAFNGSSVELFVAVEMQFDAGTFRIWSGNYDKTIGGNLFTGTGSLLNISGIEEGSDLSAKGVNISLSGIDTSIVAIALSEPYQNRVCKILVGSGNEYYEAFSGFLDVMTIEDSGDSCQINVTVESRLISLDRKVPLRYTQETQSHRYPGDTFFSTVTSLQDKKVEWNMGQD